MVGPAGDVGTCGGPLVVSNPDRHGTRPSPRSMPSDRDLVELAVLHAGARWRGTTPRIALVTNDPWVVHAGINRLVPELAMLPADLTEHAERRIKLLVPGTTVRGAVLALRREVTASGVAEVLETLSVESGADVVVVAVRPTRHLRPRQLDRVVQAVAHHHGGAQLVLVDDAGAADHGHHRRSDLPTFGDERTALVALGVCSAACSPQAR